MIQIEQRLREWIGLDAPSLGSNHIERAVRLRMKKVGLNDLTQYNHLLQTSTAERDQLIESVIVAETWFFRDHEPFAELANLAVKLRAERPNRVLRLLSAPCASGEEPYSMAIALLEAGLQESSFEIDATDISAQVLARAQQGIYGKHSFRGRSHRLRERYFQPYQRVFVLKHNIQRLVRFSQTNILSDSFCAERAPYDFIFCRNLLIYLHRQAQEQALGQIAKLLHASGVLFVGAAEHGLVLERGFVSAELPRCFAVRKADGGPSLKSANPDHQHSVLPAKANAPSNCLASRLPEEEPKLAPINGIEHLPSLRTLEDAQRLADAGQLEEATTACQNHLRDNGASAHAYYLLGLVRDAAGHSDATEFYRKALYLEPNHYETLLQLALLLEKRGDSAQARILKNRAQRSRPKEVHGESAK